MIPNTHQRLVIRLIDICILIVLLFTVFTVYPPVVRQTLMLEMLMFGIFFGLRFMVLRGVRGTEQILIGVVLLLIMCFDDGFNGAQSTWILHIPLALAVWILVQPTLQRATWWTLQGIAVVLVNHTRLTPHWDHDSLPPDFPWHHHLHLISASTASLLMLRYLSNLQAESLLLAQQQQRQAEAASHAKDEFLSHMSHELRTPLNAIQGFADLSLQTSHGELHDNLTSIRLSADHLTHLVNDILDLARLENGNVTLACDAFDPSTCIAEAIDLLRPLARQKRLPIHAPAAALPRVMGDRIRWKQILVNLVGNAIKYTSHGQVTITSHWTQTTEGHGILSVAIQDTGVGIAPDDQARIFERFQRLGGFDAPSGTGLGLAISSILTQAMQGGILLESTPGVGSTFTLSIPFALAPAAIVAPVEPATPSNLSGYRVLLAEDNRLNIRLATKVLHQLLAQFDVAEDGGAALDLLEKNHYDLLLLDLHMPVKDGFEVARTLRDPRLAHRNQHIPILALTADAFEETRRQTIDVGMNDFLSKPFRISELATRALRLVAPIAKPAIGSASPRKRPDLGRSANLDSDSGFSEP